MSPFMRAALAIIAIAVWVSTVPGPAPWAGDAGEGSQRAFHSAPQHPALLAGFVARPPWQVAGVDYPVGVPPQVLLKAPNAENLPKGTALRPEAIHIIGPDVTLDGYDLTDLTVMIDDSASGTVTIKNCGASKGVVIRSTVDATAQVIVSHCTLDGGGMASDPNFQIIKVWCPLTVTYSWIKNGPGGIQSSASLIARYNLLEGFAWSPGAHANAIYIRGTHNKADRAIIEYNTIYSQSARNEENLPVGIGAAIAFFGDGGNFYNSTVSRNVVIAALPGAASYLIGFYVPTHASATGGKITYNYLASVNGFNRTDSGAFGAFYPRSPGLEQADYSANVDMNTGRTIAGLQSHKRTTSPSR
ncbi:hypothetical protein [Methylovirgula sp. 4M-Z18]|uniref:hypothetical protein n=1 Tax=Methylovirgula sp. 4M-Z18 TaxID=2293567 RepID=UPI000E2FA6C8|nr:hypothetical protein [Methylovirgula sp. 4M-Z18]